MLISCHSRAQLPWLYPWGLFISSINFLASNLMHVFIWTSPLSLSLKCCSISSFPSLCKGNSDAGMKGTRRSHLVTFQSALCVALKNYSPSLTAENGGIQNRGLFQKHRLNFSWPEVLCLGEVPLINMCKALEDLWKESTLDRSTK